MREVEQRIAAEATTGSDTVVVQLRDQPVVGAALPESVLQYVVRTQESLILDDASAQNPFSSDAYIRRHHARSILCLPLINQAKLNGVLYLENNLTPHVFTSTRIAVLKLLASQAAISLENSRLYGDLQEREAKIRRLVDANIVGIFIWELEGQILEANDAFLRIVGYDREDLLSGRIRWTDLTPPEWLDRDKRRLTPELKMSGSVQPFEKEYFRKDGSRVPVLIGLASFAERGNQGVAFVLDLTERKRAEEALRNTQEELARVARLMTMGELAASIAHEVNQPLMAVVTNADTCLRWLAKKPPDFDEARQAAERVVSTGHRAADIVRTVRALARKSTPEMTQFDVNIAIADVLALTRGELQRHDVSLETELSAGLEPVLADRAQLQQVILNLIVNGIEAMTADMHHPRVLRMSSRMVKQDSVLLAVADTGTGFDPGNTERIFDAFFTTKPQGMGLGLSICRSIIEAHGGRLWASANMPRGAIFQFTVPARGRRFMNALQPAA